MILELPTASFVIILSLSLILVILGAILVASVVEAVKDHRNAKSKTIEVDDG